MVRSAAAASLAQIGPEAIDVVLPAADHPVRNARIAAGTALGRMGPAALEPMLSAMSRPSTRIQETAATALGLIGNERAIDVLIEGLRSSDENLREACSVALGGIGGPSVGPLTEVMEDVYWDVRAAAVVALSLTGDRRALDPIAEALRDPERPVREAAQEAMDRIENARHEAGDA